MITEDSTKDRDFESYLKITENRTKLLSMIIAMVRDFDVSEDLFQETVLEILKSKH